MRNRKGISARSLSLQAGLSPSYVSKVEAGSIEPSLRAFIALAKILEISDRELLFIMRRL